MRVGLGYNELLQNGVPRVCFFLLPSSMSTDLGPTYGAAFVGVIVESVLVSPLFQATSSANDLSDCSESLYFRRERTYFTP